jgi:hypothetical protein
MDRVIRWLRGFKLIKPSTEVQEFICKPEEVRTWQELNTFNNGESGYNALKRLCE